MKHIYLDNSATTPVDKKVIKAMKRYWTKDFANPSSIHKMGVAAKIAVQTARRVIVDFLHAHDREIVITSGGTEANNLAIFGTVNNLIRSGKKIHAITTEIEHSSILKCFNELERRGCKVSYLEVDENGLINPKNLREVIMPETALISIGYVNSEIGVIQPIKDIAKEIRHKKKEYKRERFDLPYFHSDASQASECMNMNVEELGVDMITIDAQKIYGPKGIGALFIRDGAKIEPIIFGGGQEGGRRGGTKNVPLIAGFAKAIEILEKIKEKEIVRVGKLRDKFFHEIKKFVPLAIINGDLDARIPNNINISIPGEDGEMIVLRLDEAGLTCSSSSACESGAGESNVVRKIAEKTEASKKEINERAKSTLRFSLGRHTKDRHIKYLLKCLSKLSR